MRFDIQQGDVLAWCGDYAEKIQRGQAEAFHGAFGDPPYCLDFMSTGDRDAPHRGYAREHPTTVAMLVDLLHVQSWEAAAILWYRDVFSAIRACLLPGAPVLMCAGARTDDLMAMGMRAAGLDVRTKLMYLYGSGMPHGLDISKDMDRVSGVVREVTGHADTRGRYDGHDRQDAAKFGGNVYNYGKVRNTSTLAPLTAPATEDAIAWAGYNTEFKPAYETLIYALNPYPGTFADAARRWGTVGINVDASRIAHDEPTTYTTRTAPKFQGIYRATEGADPRDTSSPDAAGRYPSNLLLQHAEGCECIGTKQIKNTSGRRAADVPSRPAKNVYGDYDRKAFTKKGDEDGMETIEDWRCVEGCPIAELDRQSGQTVSSDKTDMGETSSMGAVYGLTGYKNRRKRSTGYDDRGGASRFFYTSKVAAWEREAGLEGMPVYLQSRVNAGGLENEPRFAPKETRNPHPTLKSIRALTYLLRAIGRPPHVGGRLLVPFSGTGSEVIAARLSGGWAHIQGIELDQDERYPGAFVPIARARLSWWSQFASYEGARRAMQGERVFVRRQAEALEAGQLTLF